jgi:hypothetical protein
VIRSVLAVNDAGDSGGAIRSFGPVSVDSSLLAGNSTEGDTGGGGAIDAGQSPGVELVNSTVTDNSSGDMFGGGIIAGDVRLVYSDVVGNTSSQGANLAWEGTLASFGSVIAQPLGGGANCFVVGTTTSAGYNFSDDASCGLTATGDRQNAGDPMLGGVATGPQPGSLCIDGGCTYGLPPLPGSPLIDPIPVAQCQADGAAGVTRDVFGDPRPIGPGCDIGAAAAPVPVPNPPRFTA